MGFLANILKEQVKYFIVLISYLQIQYKFYVDKVYLNQN